MIIRKSTVSKILIMLLVLMHLCFFQILFENSALFKDAFISKPRGMLFLLMVFLSVLCVYSLHEVYRSRFLQFEIVILILLWARAAVGGMQDGYAWGEVVVLLRPYIYPILAIPLYKLLQSERWSVAAVAKFIVLAATIDTAARMADSLSMSFTGSLIWPNLVNGDMGYRNEIYRINPCTLNVIVVPLAYYLYRTSDRMSKRVFWLLCIVFDIVYTLYFWQARSAAIYKIALLIILFYTDRTSSKKKIIRMLLGVIAVAIILNTPIVSSFLGTFSESNQVYGGSTSARINAIAYFSIQYLKNPILGIGLLPTDLRYAVGGGMLEDLGFLYGIFQLGFLMILFYVFCFGRGIYVYFKVRRFDHDSAQLIIAMSSLFIMFGINIDSFYLFALAIPIYIGITEHIYSDCKVSYSEDIERDQYDEISE